MSTSAILDSRIEATHGKPDDLLLTRTVASVECEGTRATCSGLILPVQMSFDAWHELGHRVFRIADCSSWWIGDWLVYGEREYGSHRYERAIRDLSLDYQTLRNYAWVARKFPLSRRRDSLSLGHHAEVAALAEAEQDIWLMRAERLGWSRNELRRRLRAERQAARGAAPGNESTPSRVWKIEVASERHDHWQAAAERSNCVLTDWIIATLDRAAVEALHT